MNGWNFRELSGRCFAADSSQYVLIRPSSRPGFCEMYIFVWHDFSRVFIDGGQFGYTQIAREADIVEIEALAERFGFEELRRVLATRGQKTQPRSGER